MNVRDIIAATAHAPAVTAVDTGKWGTMHVRVMTGTDRDSWEAECFARKEGEGVTAKPFFRARLLVRCVCNDAGERVYKDDESPVLAAADSRLLALLYAKAFELNELGADDVDAEKNG